MAITWPAKNNYATGDVLTATNMNGIGDDLNALFDNSFYAGKNKIINGNFGIWQRGTSFSTPASGSYTADRWIVLYDGSSSTRTYSQQTFTPGTAPVAGYEGTYFYRLNQSVAGSSATYNLIDQRIEDVRTFAGQTVTFSFWAKAAATATLNWAINQSFGTGGSAEVGAASGSVTLTTSWQRFTATATLPSIAGKTIGTGSYLIYRFSLPINTTFTIDIWGCQLEAGSTATPFQTATGTVQGELAACQRYYYRQTAAANYSLFSSNNAASSTTVVDLPVIVPVTMRTTPTVLDVSNVAIADNVNANITGTLTIASTTSSNSVVCVRSTTTGLTQYRSYVLLANNNSSAYVGLGAEL